MRQTRYRQIAETLAEQIRNKTYLTGEKLPPIRAASQQFSVSVSTIQQAYRELEDLGLIEARPQSGYYVRFDSRSITEPNMITTSNAPIEVSINKTMLKVLEQSQRPGLINLGTAVLHSDFLPLQQLQRIISRLARFHIREITTAEFSTGHEGLRRQVAKRLVNAGCELSPDDIIITGGCQDAFSLCLNAVAKPGDIIVIETPTFAGLLQTIESLGMKALEIPTHPQHGISLEALALAIEQWQIKACALVPAFNNPLGSSMPVENKKTLVSLLAKHQIPLIEDDLFADLNFSGNSIPSAKSFDKEGLVLYCSSVSKSLGSGLRVGWTCPGRYFEQVKYLKAFRNISGPTLEQMIVAEFMATGGYDRHIRYLRNTFARQIQLISDCIVEYFPKGTTITRPTGGYVLWVGLPGNADTWQLYQLALNRNITFFPGELFSASGKYNSFLRINAAIPWNSETEQAIALLGQIAHDII